jgi:hypothetical protein
MEPENPMAVYRHSGWNVIFRVSIILAYLQKKCQCGMSRSDYFYVQEERY